MAGAEWVDIIEWMGICDPVAGLESGNAGTVTAFPLCFTKRRWFTVWTCAVKRTKLKVLRNFLWHTLEKRTHQLMLADTKWLQRSLLQGWPGALEAQVSLMRGTGAGKRGNSNLGTRLKSESAVTSNSPYLCNEAKSYPGFCVGLWLKHYVCLKNIPQLF